MTKLSKSKLSLSVLFFYDSSNHRKNLWDRVDKYHIDTISDLGFVSVKLLKKTTLRHTF